MASVFDFTSIKAYPEAPELLQFQARDGSSLSYRFYDSLQKETACILLHGSGAHGEYLHPLASYLSYHGAGCVYIPNIRGHYMSGTKRGDCSYIGQLEDDLIDLIQNMGLRHKKIFLLGHSSGGGLAIRFAGGHHSVHVHGYILLSPAIPRSETMRQGTAGGWAKIHLIKLLFCSFLNEMGCTLLNHTRVISFNRPKEVCDGTETLEYSFNLNTSYHPRYPFDNDMKSIGDNLLVMIGSEDEANDPSKYQKVMKISSKQLQILDKVRHLNIVSDPTVMEIALNWIKKKSKGTD